MRIYILTVALIVTLISCNSFNSNKKDLKDIITSRSWYGDSLENAYTEKNEWYDKNGILHWQLNYKKSPLILTFHQDSAVIEVPKLTNIMEMASIVHIHGTSLANEKRTRFVYEYDIDEDDSTITLNDGIFNSIELKYYNGKISWPLWRMHDSLLFLTKGK